MGTDLLPFSEVTSVVAAVSVIGIFLLLPLYLSQRRDVMRLREWMQGEPRPPGRGPGGLGARSSTAPSATSRRRTPIAASRFPGTMEFEAVKAATAVKEPGKVETAAFRSRGEPPHQRAARPGPGDDGALGARAAPALEAVRGPGDPAALACRHRARRARPRRRRDHRRRPGPARRRTTERRGLTEPGGIEVAVLNTTTASGIAGRVAAQIEDAGYIRGQVGNIERDTDQTIVMYAPDQKRAANRVARELGDVAVQEIDREVQAAAGGADVVVILGQDRVAP